MSKKKESTIPVSRGRVHQTNQDYRKVEASKRLTAFCIFHPLVFHTFAILMFLLQLNIFSFFCNFWANIVVSQ